MRSLRLVGYFFRFAFARDLQMFMLLAHRITDFKALDAKILLVPDVLRGLMNELSTVAGPRYD